jgi:hypothetical protein
LLRAIATRLQQEIADTFGYTAIDSFLNGPRDVLWCPAEIAPRNRMEQSARLERARELNTPFMSFWRIGERPNRSRRNLPLAYEGAYTNDDRTEKYKMRPVKLAFQVEHWAHDEEDHEFAIETYLKWIDPEPELVLTDINGVTFQMPMQFQDPKDNSRIPEIYKIGRLHRETFVFTVDGYVIDATGDVFVTIETITWNIWDYSAYGTVEDAVLLKTPPDITESFHWDAEDAVWDDPTQVWG